MSIRLRPLLSVVSWALYPLIIFFGLRLAEARYVAVALLATLLLRRRRNAARFLVSLTAIDRTVLGGLLLLAGATALTNSEDLLRFYPAAVNLGMLLLFGGSLISPPSMIERFARLADPDLPPVAIGYTRRVTQIWCVFFIANGAISLYTALQAGRDAWALYNGCIAYVLMGVLLGGEWLFRRFYLAVKTG